MKCSLGISNFLEEISSLFHSVLFLYFFAWSLRKAFFISPCNAMLGFLINIYKSVIIQFIGCIHKIEAANYLLQGWIIRKLNNFCFCYLTIKKVNMHVGLSLSLYIYYKHIHSYELPWWLNGKESACQSRRSLGWEDPLKKVMTIHSSILAWRMLWTEEPEGL